MDEVIWMIVFVKDVRFPQKLERIRQRIGVLCDDLAHGVHSSVRSVAILSIEVAVVPDNSKPQEVFFEAVLFTARPDWVPIDRSNVQFPSSLVADRVRPGCCV